MECSEAVDSCFFYGLGVFFDLAAGHATPAVPSNPGAMSLSQLSLKAGPSMQYPPRRFSLTAIRPLTRRLAGVVAAVVLTAILSPSRAVAQDCDCVARGNARIAGALGGGLFAGLLAAVLQLGPHGAPSAAAGDPAVVPVAPDPGAPPVVAAPSPGVVALPAKRVKDPSAAPHSGPSAQRLARPSSAAAAPMPALTPRDARREGLVPPRTATFLPAIAMIGVGALLLGLFLVRERAGRGRPGR